MYIVETPIFLKDVKLAETEVSLAEPGCFYQMEYRVGGGGGHKITVEDWVPWERWMGEGTNKGQNTIGTY